MSAAALPLARPATTAADTRSRVRWWPVLAWLTAAAVAGIALVFLYPDSYQQDGGTHFMGARWALAPTHHSMLVDVWGRPLFTVLYLVPAHFGYPVAKLFTVLICLVTGWQSWRLADDLSIERAPLVVPLLFLQPSYLLLCADTMTEPLFALVLVIALRLHVAGRIKTGMIVASTLVLARPEGFVLGLLWGVWVLLDRRDPRAWWRRLPSTLLLATGMAAWWLAALAITHDPLFILHNWPSNWSATSATYGTGSFWDYWRMRADIVGHLLTVPFIIGGIVLLLRRRFWVLTTTVLAIFVVHSLLREYGRLGTAGYARYFVCVAPAVALIALVGWNLLADALTLIASLLWRRRMQRLVVIAAETLVLLLVARYAVRYVDGMGFLRDAWAVDDTFAWFEAHPRPVRQLVWSQIYMAIRFDWDPWDHPALTSDRQHNVALLAAEPPGTLVFWDADTGPNWFALRPGDLEAAGYTRLRSKQYVLCGYLARDAACSDPRRQTMSLYYK